ncbi:hypothetical protein PTTG_29304 [Puccinia triticina 1-1 BBBD Race 1]|uniref:SNF2 N-terminal domain-containing protein n=1 Tax=Puccinia triticina (isolate 1-1 / race 1 (BBBD)) TaxID=630390 RepID=A0A180G552_PUCT1|nr:hypothetical protein PTTG_29304 [Puccinia triticina 1-1 BBBD Race 1]
MLASLANPTSAKLYLSNLPFHSGKEDVKAQFGTMPIASDRLLRNWDDEAVGSGASQGGRSIFQLLHGMPIPGQSVMKMAQVILELKVLEEGFKTGGAAEPWVCSGEAALASSPTNYWICRNIEQPGINTAKNTTPNTSQGSILADNMGLGKTLTTLAYILATEDLAAEYYWGDWYTDHQRPWFFALWLRYPIGSMKSGSTLRDCPRQSTSHEESQGNPTHNIRQLESKFCICLTGTPVQNRLTDLQSLITGLKLAPWDDEQIWQRCLIPQMKVGAPKAIKSLTQLMELVCLRRTKDVILNLPNKVEHAVVVRCSLRWEPFLLDLHARFIRMFGRLRTSGEHWDPAEFFRQLTMLRQFCNHPIFARAELPVQTTWLWQDSGKVILLVESIQNFLRGARGIQHPKAVVFSSFVGFLRM